MGLAWFPNRVGGGRTLVPANEVSLLVEEQTRDGSGPATLWLTGVAWPVRVDTSMTSSQVVSLLGQALNAAAATIVNP